MRIIAWSALAGFAEGHRETAVTLARWRTLVRSANWTSMDHVRRAAPSATVLNAERVKFEIAGGNYRLVIAVDFDKQIVFVRFIGTHGEYDKIDALTVSRF